MQNARLNVNVKSESLATNGAKYKVLTMHVQLPYLKSGCVWNKAGAVEAASNKARLRLVPLYNP
jgi:hypothetical protein